MSWEQISGPEGVVIANPTALKTMAEFAVEGEYDFRLTATDGVVTVSDEVAIMVTNGLIKYWPFDGNLLDFLGNPATPVPMGNPLFVGPLQAKVGSGAMRMDGRLGFDR